MTAPPMLLVMAQIESGDPGTRGLWRWHVYNWRTGGIACGEGSDLGQIAAELFAVTGLNLAPYGAKLHSLPGWRILVRQVEDPVSRAGPNGPPAAGVLPGVQAPDAAAVRCTEAGCPRAEPGHDLRAPCLNARDQKGRKGCEALQREVAPDRPPGHGLDASVGLARTGSTPGPAGGSAGPMGGSPEDAAADLIRCAQCATVIGLSEPRNGGRPRTYCSARCRQRAHRAAAAQR